MSKTSNLAFSIGMNLSSVLRATETFQPPGRRLFEAEFDYAMLPAAWRILLLPGLRSLLMGLLERSGMGTPGMVFCRTRFSDDALQAWLGDGEQQVVCLGAGNDNRAYRLPGLERLHYFELDLPVPQEHKKEHVRQLLGRLPAHVTYIAADFEDQDLDSKLREAGFRIDLPTFFIMEGVSQYISEGAMEYLVAFIAGTHPGSQLVFTYIQAGIIDGSARSPVDQRIMQRVSRQGLPWVFGLATDQLEGWLAARGLVLIDQAGASDYRQRYLLPAGREMQIYAGESIALVLVPG